MRSRIAIALLAAMTSLPSLVAQHVSIMGNFSASSGSLGSRPLSSSPGSMSVTFGQPREPERIFGHRLFPLEFFLGTPLFADYPLADAQRTAAVVNIQTSPATPSGGEGTEPAMSPVARPCRSPVGSCRSPSVEDTCRRGPRRERDDIVSEMTS